MLNVDAMVVTQSETGGRYVGALVRDRNACIGDQGMIAKAAVLDARQISNCGQATVPIPQCMPAVDELPD